MLLVPIFSLDGGIGPPDGLTHPVRFVDLVICVTLLDLYSFCLQKEKKKPPFGILVITIFFFLKKKS